MARRQDQAVGADVGQGDALLLRQRMVYRGNQRRVEGDHRLVADVVRYLQHRTDGEIHLIGTQHRQTVASGDVVQLEPDVWIRLGEALHRLRQDVEDGRLAGGDIELARLQLAELGGEGLMQLVDTLHQRLRQLVQRLPLRGHLDLRAAPLEQGDAELPLQRLDLQRHRGLAQEQRFRRQGNTAGAGGMTEGAQLLEAVLLVVEVGHRGHGGDPLLDFQILRIEIIAASNKRNTFMLCSHIGREVINQLFW